MSTSLRTAVAAVILIVPVALELAWHPFGDHAFGMEVFAVSQIVGWLLIGSVCRQAAAPTTRLGRFGRAAVLVGCGLQVAFGAVYGATAFDGEPWEAAFLPFLLGFLALFVGGVTWGISLLRSGAAPWAGRGLLAVGVLGLMAMLFGMDPWHDIFLLSAYAAWVIVGRGLDTSTLLRTPTAPASPVDATTSR